MSLTDIRADETRDRELCKMAATEIENTIREIRLAVDQNEYEKAYHLSSALRDQCASYRDLREINGS